MSTSASDFHGDATLKGDSQSREAWRRRTRWFLLWGAASTVLAFASYHLFPPTYDAYATLRVEPPHVGLLGDPHLTNDSLDIYINTQIEFIRSDRILKPAIAESTVAMLPFVRHSLSPIQDVRNGLRVRNSDNTFFLQIAFRSEDPFEASAIVNAVTNTYLQAAGEYQEGRNANEIRYREKYLEDIWLQLQGFKEALAKVTNRLDRPVVRPPDVEPASPTSFGAMTDALYRIAAGRLLQADIDLIEAQSQVGGGDARTEKIESLKKLRSGLRGVLAGRESEAADRIEAADLTRRIEALARYHDELFRRLEEVKFANSRDLVRIELVHPAEVLQAPTDHPRFRLMLLAPVAVLVALGSVAAFGSLRRRRVGRVQEG